MEESRYEQSLRPEISQGDIFSDIAFIDWMTHPDGRIDIVGSRRSCAMLLTFDCEYDKPASPPNHILIAKVIPLQNAPINSQGVIRKEKGYSIFYLPASGDFPESFVDFRQMERVGKMTVTQSEDIGDRVLSLTSTYRRKLRLALARFFGMSRDSEVDPE